MSVSANFSQILITAPTDTRFFTQVAFSPQKRFKTHTKSDPGSPCIDAGDNYALPPEATTDLDGCSRLIDGNCNGTTIDMGLCELTYTHPRDLDTKCDVDFGDYVILADFWLRDERQANTALILGRAGIVDTPDLAVLSYNWLAGR